MRGVVQDQKVSVTLRDADGRTGFHIDLDREGVAANIGRSSDYHVNIGSSARGCHMGVWDSQILRVVMQAVSQAVSAETVKDRAFVEVVDDKGAAVFTTRGK
ncbi:MAG: hypothetical protein H6718_00140 [Polyangiaceae bacterium]|nr:hypothetical protein [Polyangiaceae bacterium]MCB9870141.1 hypothetical protein [Planctomycetota bacterium]